MIKANQHQKEWGEKRGMYLKVGIWEEKRFTKKWGGRRENKNILKEDGKSSKKRA